MTKRAALKVVKPEPVAEKEGPDEDRSNPRSFRVIRRQFSRMQKDAKDRRRNTQTFLTELVQDRTVEDLKVVSYTLELLSEIECPEERAYLHRVLIIQMARVRSIECVYRFMAPAGIGPLPRPVDQALALCGFARRLSSLTDKHFVMDCVLREAVAIDQVLSLEGIDEHLALLDGLRETDALDSYLHDQLLSALSALRMVTR